ncbi:aminodeoxychorismate synthase [Nemania sp. FL0916]|nr:aminodeoxychorismate synthase [Nemania sp. FL0916]
MSCSGRPRILFIDAYDSFSNNIVSLLTTELGADVDVLPIDPPHLNNSNLGAAGFHDALRKQVRPYHAVVCGPGPGAPDVDKDVGIMKHIWGLEGQDLVPVLGICLGFQSLVVSCGAPVKRLRTGLHGMIREIDHLATSGEDRGNMFADVPAFKATLYHSLHADIGQESIPAAEWQSAKWASPRAYANIVPLAWTYEDRGDSVERILMGVRHRSKPFWGLQYHPESICTETTGHQVIVNWFREAMAWNCAMGRDPASVALEPRISDNLDARIAHDSSPWLRSGTGLASFGLDAKYLSLSLDIPLHIEVPDIVEILQDGKSEFIVLDSASAKTKRKGLDVRGRYSIIALDVDEALKLEYRTGERHITARRRSDSSAAAQETTETVDLGAKQTIWQFLADFWTRRQMRGFETPAPFAGGFMGYTTYELGLEGIDVELLEERHHARPDLCFAWVTKSIVIDHLEGSLRIQTLCSSSSASKGQEWLESISDRLVGSAIWSNAMPVNFGSNSSSKVLQQQHQQITPPHTPTAGHLAQPEICVPEAGEYEAKVRLCQDYIAAGDSYELCLTDQTLITRPRSRVEGSLQPPHHPHHHHHQEKHTAISSSPSSWQLYRSLRTRQPAPFGSYLRLGAATLVSSSPERFLAISIDSAAGSQKCSMRPMKGTVRKSPAVATLAAAERILHVPKEEAENLMIVDLVRHDLHRVCGPGNVSVPHLLQVEEYASVFQMISVVEGQLPALSLSTSPFQEGEGDGGKSRNRGEGERGKGVTGLDVLAASLPPGSMTGAPKKRSCEILQTLEGPRGRERSLYSGVVGYMDVAGRADWSVTIRSLFRWDDEVLPSTAISALDSVGAGVTVADVAMETETWHIGAGGAVTALSTPEGETDEMFTKLKGPVGVFEEP